MDGRRQQAQEGCAESLPMAGCVPSGGPELLPAATSATLQLSPRALPRRPCYDEARSAGMVLAPSPQPGGCSRRKQVASPRRGWRRQTRGPALDDRTQLGGKCLCHSGRDSQCPRGTSPYPSLFLFLPLHMEWQRPAGQEAQRNREPMAQRTRDRRHQGAAHKRGEHASLKKTNGGLTQPAHWSWHRPTRGASPWSGQNRWREGGFLPNLGRSGQREAAARLGWRPELACEALGQPAAASTSSSEPGPQPEAQGLEFRLRAQRHTFPVKTAHVLAPALTYLVAALDAPPPANPAGNQQPRWGS